MGSSFRVLAGVFVVVVVVAWAFCVPPSAARAADAAAAVRPNVVLIIADDLGAEDCGPYGNPNVRTPNLDRLAREGMRFDRAFLTCSSCSPSRASIITGRYPHQTGAMRLHEPLPKESVTFVEVLRQAGYWTAQAGKWHLGPAVKDRFDLVNEGGQPSGCERWVETLNARPTDKPFFLWLASFDPHRDYRPGAIDPPHAERDAVVPPYLPDVPETRRDLALYYDEIGRLDAYVGRVLDGLDAQGVARDTVVIFMADNGRAFPRCKTSVYDSGIRTPLIVRWPARVKPGATCGGVVSSVDLAPTILALAGVAAPESLVGKDVSPLLDDPAKTVREYAFAEHNWHDFDDHGRAVRSARFKYIRNHYTDVPGTPPADAVRGATYQVMRRLRDEGKLTPAQTSVFLAPRPAEELYDTEADPHELTNLAADASHAKTLAELRAALTAWEKETGDRVPAQRTPDKYDRETGRLPKNPAGAASE